MLHLDQDTFSEGNKGYKSVKTHAGIISVTKTLLKSMLIVVERMSELTLTLFTTETREVDRRAAGDTSFYMLL